MFKFKEYYEQQEQHELPIRDNKLELNTSLGLNNLEPDNNLNPILTEFCLEATDMSLDRQIHTVNAYFCKKVFIDYLHHCLDETIDDENILKIMKFAKLNDVHKNETNQADNLTVFIYENQFLNERSKKHITKNLQEHPDLRGFLIEIKNIFGSVLTEEIIFIVAHIFQLKMLKFKELNKNKEQNFIPKMNRFAGEEGFQTFFDCGWQVYQDIDYSIIKSFAQQDIEKHIDQLFKSEKLKFMTLSILKCKIKDGIRVVDKFTTFVTHISRCIFLTLSGFAQREQDIDQFLSELKVETTHEGFSYQGNLSKRVKLDEW